MGNPLILSFDSIIFYPYCVVPCAKYFSRVHPNFITAFNCLVKWWAFCAILSWSPWRFLLWGTLERYLDCLDGVAARKFNKSSTFGHWMDKSTDLVYRWSSALSGCVRQSLFYRKTLWHRNVDFHFHRLPDDLRSRRTSRAYRRRKYAG